MPARSTKVPSRARRAGAPTTVVYVRHGLCHTTGKVLPGRAPGLHLSPKGVEQAEGVAESIAGWARVAAVYTSPLERARETAAPIARRLGLRGRGAGGLVECDFGDWTGARLAALMRRKEWQTVQQWPSGFRFPNGESFVEMQARMLTTVQELVARHRGQIIVAVSHADPIKSAVADALGLHLDRFQRIVIEPCSISVVTYAATGPRVGCVNQSPTARAG